MSLIAAAPAAQARFHWLPAPHTTTRQTRLTRLVVGAARGPPMRDFPAPPPTPSVSTSNGSVSPSQAAPSSSSSGGSAAAPAAAAVKSYRVTPWQAMAFNGAVPERVNGRLAMLAIMYIARQEMETGQTGGYVWLRG